MTLFFCLFTSLAFAVNSPPQVGTITPSSGTSNPNQPVIFTTTYTDPDGWQNIRFALFLINNELNLKDCFLGLYNPRTHKLYLRKEKSTRWIGGFSPGSSNIIENSYAKLDCSKTSVSRNATTLTLNWSITFKSTFVGTKNTYLRVGDSSRAISGWTKKGTWTIPNQNPSVGTITPSSGTSNPNQTVSFTTTYSDPNGWQDILFAYFLINTKTDGKDGFLSYYDQNLNKLYLRNDENTVWLGGFNPGSSNIIENSYAKLDCSQTTVSGSDTTLTINWSITFKSTFAGTQVKNLYLYVEDDSGAVVGWVQKGSWKIVEGVLVGPEGGIVTSDDQMVKVIIPAGALSQPEYIKVSTLNNQSLENVVPGGTSLLSIAECKPYGLVFNKPVSIIYTLYQAEIPGTPVELGFYDAVQKKIISTGQTSTVPADGYTLTFSVMHFSTYAALKNLTPQSTPIGSGVKIPLPDMLTGSFSHTIPITIPPGRKGIQPSLAISHRSSNSNSWVGQGFSLNPGYIVRSTRLGPPTYIDTQDTFYFITDAGTTELVNLIDNLYQAKVESSFTKFFKEPDDSWKVVGKDGSVLRFGQTSDAKETSTSGTFSWYLTKVVDTNGNYIEYHYTKDQGKSYLSRIDYTGNEMGVSPSNYIEFFLESRSDISSSYISSSKIVTAKRLKEIEVKVGYDLVWRYVLEYNYSQDTNRSLLKSIIQYGSDNKNLPQQSFSYQRAR